MSGSFSEGSNLDDDGDHHDPDPGAPSHHGSTRGQGSSDSMSSVPPPPPPPPMASGAGGRGDGHQSPPPSPPPPTPAPIIGAPGISGGQQRRPYATQPPRPPPKKGCLLSFCHAIFGSRQLAEKGNREQYIGYTIRELVVYILFMIVLCLLTAGMMSSTYYYYTKVMYSLFIDKEVSDNMDARTFRDSAFKEDFWDFVEHSLIQGVFRENSQLPGSIVGAGTGVGSLPEPLIDPERVFILYENQLMGVPQLRQLRVRTDKCPIADNFRHLTRTCYPPYEASLEDKGDEQGYWSSTDTLRSDVKEAFRYRTETELKGSSHWGDLATYSGAGAVQILAKTKPGSQELIRNLKNSDWITWGTRAVILDFTVYNANINLFCVVRLVWEFPAAGGVITSWSLRTVRLIHYLTWYDNWIVFPCEILFCIFTLYYLIQEILEMCHLCFFKYIQDIWSWLDVSLLILSGVCIAFSVYRYILVQETLEALTTSEAVFHDFEFIGFWQTQFNNAVSIFVFFSWVKIFKYISFNKTMSQLSNTLSRCAKDIGGFAIMFFIVFFAFAQLGFLIFGAQVDDFSTFEDSVFTLLRLILGDFNFRAIEEANRVLGPIYFLAYVFFVFFVLLNMFLAIINDTYSEVKAEIQAQRNEFEISDYFKRCFNNFRGMFGKRSAKMDAEHAIRLASADGQITYDELKDNLRNEGFSDIEIEMFLARYELDQDRVLDEEETHQVLADLEGKRIVLHGDQAADLGPSTSNPQDQPEHRRISQFSKGPDGRKVSDPREEGIRNEELMDLQDRVGVMESAITGMIRRLDDILHSMDHKFEDQN